MSTRPFSHPRRALVGLALVAAGLAAVTGLGSSPVGAGTPPYCEDDDLTLYICRSYYGFARRTPTEAEVDYWVPQMSTRRTVFIAVLGKSLESRRRTIEMYYDLFADRDAGAPEKAYWEGEVLGPNGLRRLEAALLAEFPGPPADLVGWAYQAMLDREPGMEETLYWEERAEAGGYGAMAAALAGTPEVRNTRVHWAYVNELGHVPDPASRDYWANRLRTGTSYLELRIALKAAGYPNSSGVCSTPAPYPVAFC